MKWILLLGACLGQVSPASEPGPRSVGVTTLVFHDSARADRILKTEIWYPAVGDSGRGPARDVAPAEGKFPVILFSHGSNATRMQSTYLTEHWASHGFVVIAPDHKGNTVLDGKTGSRYQSALDRPRDASFVLDRMLSLNEEAGGKFEGRIDEQRIGAAGHSFGGYTVLVLVGARVDDRAASDLVGRTVEASVHPPADPRIKAIIAYAPPGTPIFDDKSLGRIQTPTLVFSGMNDQILSYEAHQLPLFEALGGRSYLVAFPGGSHFTFNNAEFLGLVSLVKPKKKVEENLDRARADDVVRAVSLAFWRRHLLNDDRLEAAFADYPELANFRERAPRGK